MQPLIDGDILRYEVGYAAEYQRKAKQKERFPDNPEKWTELPDFGEVQEMLDGRIRDICLHVNATEQPLVFLTGKKNFRNDIAETKVYKGNRLDAKKPFHYANISAYLRGAYDVIEAEGMEADDLLCIEQCSRPTGTTIICSRDKDLRQCSGWHYGWELGRQPQFGPLLVDGIGWIKLEGKKLTGVGDKFFYAQILMGDSVDNVPGLPGCGPISTWEHLGNCTRKDDLYNTVKSLYVEHYKDEWKERLLEQARLVWMVRELDINGKPVMWELPE